MSAIQEWNKREISIAYRYDTFLWPFLVINEIAPQLQCVKKVMAKTDGQHLNDTIYR